MLTLVQFSLAILAVALLIGIATGWWAFGHRRRQSATTPRPEDPTAP